MKIDTQPSVKFEGEVDIKRRSTPMTNHKPPVAPVEGLVAEMSSLLHATFLNNLLRHTDVPHENRMLIQSQMNDFAVQLAQPFIERLAHLEALIPLADAACDYADQNCRWFDISTAPKDEGVAFLVSTEVRNSNAVWQEVHVVHLDEGGEIHTDCHQGWSLNDYTHWAPLPPSNPPLPAVFAQLGQALEKIKGDMP